MSVLQRIEALAGPGRYAVTFRHDDTGEQTAVVQLREGTVMVAAASLPQGWAVDTPGFRAVTEALIALDRAREATVAVAPLRDVEGGWDVMMGNVVERDGQPTCTAHGPMSPNGAGAEHVCETCGARCLFGG